MNIQLFIQIFFVFLDAVKQGVPYTRLQFTIQQP